MRVSASLALVFLTGLAYAGGSDGSVSKPQSFEHTRFCQQNGCVKVIAWERFTISEPYLYEVYRIKTFPGAELGLYRNRAGEIRGVTYQTLQLDTWADQYATAAQFVEAVFPGIGLSKAHVRSLAEDEWPQIPAFQWRGHRLTLDRQNSLIAPYSQVSLGGLSIGIRVSGGQ